MSDDVLHIEPVSVEEILSENNIEALWTHDLPAIRHAVGFTGSAANLVWRKDDLPLLFVDGRYTLQAGYEAKDRAEVITAEGAIIQFIAEALKERKISRLGFDATNFTYYEWHTLKDALGGDIELVPVEIRLQALRMIKSKQELEIIRKGIEMADASLRYAIENYLKVGVSEKEFAWQLERRMRESGAEGMSFPPLVAAGEHAAVIHAQPGEKKFEQNQCVLIDFGLVFNGYCTDRTDTVAIGTPPDEMVKIFHIVKDAHDFAIDAIKPGVDTIKIDAIARDHIASKGYGEYFTHGLGHGVGLEIHELPVFSPRARTVLEPGMVITVEPGIYIEGLGGVRIEDMILVTEDGVEVLTPPRPNDMPTF